MLHANDRDEHANPSKDQHRNAKSKLPRRFGGRFRIGIDALTVLHVAILLIAWLWCKLHPQVRASGLSGGDVGETGGLCRA